MGLNLVDPQTVIPEADFQATVVGIAVLNGWTVFSTKDSRRSPKGEPDLRMVHPVWKRMVWMELKKEGEKPTPEQDEALSVLERAGEECYLCRPSDLDLIERVLSQPKKWGVD